jgi:hypothetical protein
MYRSSFFFALLCNHYLTVSYLSPLLASERNHPSRLEILLHLPLQPRSGREQRCLRPPKPSHLSRHRQEPSLSRHHQAHALDRWSIYPAVGVRRGRRFHANQQDPRSAHRLPSRHHQGNQQESGRDHQGRERAYVSDRAPVGKQDGPDQQDFVNEEGVRSLPRLSSSCPLHFPWAFSLMSSLCLSHSPKTGATTPLPTSMGPPPLPHGRSDALTVSNNPYAQGPAPGMTPNPYANAVGRTPNPYADAGGRTPAFAAGRTPNPYGGKRFLILVRLDSLDEHR